MLLGSNYIKNDNKHEKISGDCLEALIGAIFLDSSIKNAEKFILNYWKSSLMQSDLTNGLENKITRIQPKKI